jgi:hypothetical protein
MILPELVYSAQAVAVAVATDHNQMADQAATAEAVAVVVIILQFTLLLTEHTSKLQQILQHLEQITQVAAAVEADITVATHMVQEAEEAREL